LYFESSINFKFPSTCINISRPKAILLLKMFAKQSSRKN